LLSDVGVKERATFRKEKVMPLVQVKVIEGVFSEDDKQQMISRLTDAMVSVEGEALRPVTWVMIEEVKGGDWGIGGKGLRASDVHALQAATPA
jgi:4-oxalocrotonate tautomerase